MNNKKLNLIMQVTVFFTVISLVFVSCKKDPVATDPIASFQYEISADNYLEVAFTNYSQNSISYSWDFGDSQTSVEENPTHTYDAAGTYTVALTASNEDGTSHVYSEDITITEPDAAYRLLTGDVSKTWKLYRVGTSMSLGPNAAAPGGWWAGLENDGARPCLYNHEFTFHYDGTYGFEDNGWFWGEYGVFNGQWNYEICFEALPENMINLDGIDVSDWLSNDSHSFTYDPSAGTATVNGLGAWIGICKLTTAGETTIPVASSTFNVEITEETGYDLMTVTFDWGDGEAGGLGLWTIVYVNYSDETLEPDVVYEEEPYGIDLDPLTPIEMWNTFETSSSFVVLDTAAVYTPAGGGTAANGLTFTMAVTDPAGGGTDVGQYDRYGTYQELQFMMDYDIQFDNFTTVSVDVYMPSSNDYSGTLTKDVIIVIAEASQTDGWWNGHIQYEAVATVMDEWVTYTFNLDSPDGGAGSYTPFERDDLDFFAISLGGGGHDDPGTFYVRNFQFN